MRFPDPRKVRAGFERRGFVLVPDLLEPAERSALAAEAVSLVRGYSAVIDRANDKERLSYAVVTGDRIKTDGPLLFSLYAGGEMLGWIQQVTGSASLAVSPHLRSAVNVNCLQRAGQQYPWHRDAIPYTCLLFLSSVPQSAGGAFLIRAADGAVVAIQPASGDLLLMDGARCPHAVSPLTADTLRLTVPMVYPAATVNRPAGLDEYLYGGGTSVERADQTM